MFLLYHIYVNVLSAPAAVCYHPLMLLPTQQVLFVRHAQSKWNVAEERERVDPHAFDELQGIPGAAFELSEAGHQALHQLAGTLELVQANDWICSPYIRAVHTAETLNPLAQWRKVPLWHERSWGDLEHTGLEGRLAYGGEAVLDTTFVPPGVDGESEIMAQKRVRLALDLLHDGFSVVVSHAGIIRDACHLLVPNAPLIEVENIGGVLYRNGKCQQLSLADPQSIQLLQTLYMGP